MSQVVLLLTALGVGGGVTALVQGWVRRRQSGAETTDVITQAAERAVGVISADNVRLRVQVDGLVAQVERLSSEVHGLRDQIRAQTQQIVELQHENEVLLKRLAEWDPNQKGGG